MVQRRSNYSQPLSTGPDNGLTTQGLWWLPAERQLLGENRIEFRQKTPGWRWGVTQLGLYAPGSAFGNLTSLAGGDRAHSTGFELHLPEDPDGYLLELTGYDADWDYEIGVDLNAETLLDLPAGQNNGWSAPDHLVLPADWLNPGDNVLRISNRVKASYNWGVRLVRLLPMTAALGYNLPGQAASDRRADAVRYLIPPLGDNAELRLGYYDVDFNDELALLQDGLSLGNAAITVNNRWGAPETLVIPLGLRSVITIDNTYNPPNSYIWGVRIEGLE